MTQGYLNDDLNNNSQMQTTSAPRQANQQQANTQQSGSTTQPSQSSNASQSQGSGRRGFINEATDTVESRMTGLLSQDSDYMRSAETAGRQAAASRGLSNSSMAVGAAEAARINAALPIAQQDASLYGQSSLSTQGHSQNTDLTNQQFENSTALNTQQNQHATSMQDSAHSQNMEVQEYNTASNYMLNEQQNSYQGAQNTQQQVAALQQNEQSQISAIERDPNMSGPEKDAAIRRAQEYTRSQQNILMSMSGLDSLGELEFEDAPVTQATPSTQQAPAQTSTQPLAHEKNGANYNPNRSGNDNGD